MPLLVVEILSAGTRSRGQVTKRRAYEQEGVASYWIVDPKRPAVTALELCDGTYTEVASRGGLGVVDSRAAVRRHRRPFRPAALIFGEVYRVVVHSTHGRPQVRETPWSTRVAPARW